MRTAALIALALLALLVVTPSAWCAPADFQVHTITMSANVPVKATLPPGLAVKDPMYRNSAGDWRPLEVTKSPAGISFSLPPDASQRAVILLDKPPWLVLPDTEAPILQAVSVGSVALDLAAETMDAGHFWEVPAIIITVADRLNPIATGRARAYLSGRPLDSYGGKLEIDQSADGKHADLTISPGSIPEAKYTLTLIVPDATPAHNLLKAQLVFSTAPLLRNGDFEQGRFGSTPYGWRIAAWGPNPETKYESIVVKGAGRSGAGLRMTGIAGSLYLVVGQQVEVVPGETYLFTGYYKTEADQQCGVSLCGKAEGDLPQQYVISPTFEPAADWTPFSWEVTAELGHTFYEVFVWSKSQGSVFFDDLQLRPKDQ